MAAFREDLILDTTYPLTSNSVLRVNFQGFKFHYFNCVF